jgi:hypothetical protein
MVVGSGRRRERLRHRGAGNSFCENVHVEFKKDMGVMFNVCVKVKELVTKMEETKEAFELISWDGKSFVTRAKVIAPQWNCACSHASVA